MVAIFSGLGAGVERSSANLLGNAGQLGNANLGRGGENVSVNIATGNLVVSRRDEFLTGIGSAATISRSYNSILDAGGHDRDNGDGWQQSTTLRVFDENAGVSVKRLGADGSVITYNWEQRTVAGAPQWAYWAEDGAGSHDKLVKVGTGSTATWTWTDGSTQVTETYAIAHGSTTEFRITNRKDLDQNALTFTYVAGTNDVQRITTANGEYIEYVRSGQNIVEVRTRYTDLHDQDADGNITEQFMLTRARYAYDAYNRLISVKTDLTPEDNSIADNKFYETTYTYSGTSNRVQTISQTDGSYITINYDASNRVSSIVQSVDGSTSRTTSFTYGASDTTVNYQDGTSNRLYYDSQKRLTQINYVAAKTGASVTSENFTYDLDGNVTSVRNRAGEITFYEYDGNTLGGMGNVTKVTDPNGNVTERFYDGGNRLIREVRRGSNAGSDDAVHYSHYAYDGEGHLAYAIDPEGRVTEYRYTTDGQLQYAYVYAEQLYTVSATTPTFTAMNSWRDGLSDRSSVQVVQYYTDLRGNSTEIRRYSSASATGVGSETLGWSRTYFRYDQAGQLKNSRDHNDANARFDYDGLGRMILSVDAVNNQTVIEFIDATNSKTRITNAAGFKTVTTYNRAGEVVSTSESTDEWGNAIPEVTTSTSQYDNMGRLKVFTDARGDRTFYLYDKLGRQTGKVDELGYLTEFFYDDAGRVIASVAHLNSSATHLAALAIASNTLTTDLVRPADSTANAWNFTIYDDGGRIVQTIDASGAVTGFKYDRSNNLVSTTAYAVKVDTSAWKTAAGPQLTPLTMNDADANNIVMRNFYDASGRQIGTLDGEGYLTRMAYDGAGQMVSRTAFANKVSASLRAAGTFTQLLASAGAAGRSAYNVYDGQGQLRFTVDNLGYVTKFAYDNSQRVTQTTVYANPITTTDYTFDWVNSAIVSSAADRASTTVYDSAGRVASVTDSVGLVTTYTYDALNNVQSVTSNDSGNIRTSYSYHNAEGQLRYSVDAEGFVTRFDYDAGGLNILQRRYDQAIAEGNRGSRASVESALTGANTLQLYVDESFTYDDLGRLSSSINGKGEVTRSYYNGAGFLNLITTDPAGTDEAKTSYSFVFGDRVSTIESASGQDNLQLNGAAGEKTTVQYGYDTFGRTITVTDGRGAVTANVYNSRGELVSVTEAVGTPQQRTTTYEYNAYGEVVKVTDPRGNSSYTYYDALGRVTHTRDAEDYVTYTQYTAFGEVASVTRYYNKATGTPNTTTPPSVTPHAKDAVTAFVYDKGGRVTSTTDAEGFVETYTYNGFGERTSITAKSEFKFGDANTVANTTTYTYDRRGLLLSETLPTKSFRADGTQQTNPIKNTYTYDARGNRLTMTEASGLVEQRVTTYVYDKANRLIESRGQAREVYSQSNHQLQSAAYVPVETISYDKRGNVVTTVDASGARTVFFYDDLNRKVVEINALGTYTAYEYDANGNVARIRVFETTVAVPTSGGAQENAPVAPGGVARETRFEYDALNRMTKSWVVGVHNGTFNGTSWVANADNFETLYQYDANGNVIKTTDPMGNQTFAYYDKLGRKVGQVDASRYYTKWQYDSEGNVLTETQFAVQLASASTTLPPDPSATGARITSYTYDEVGNRLSETRQNVLVHDGNGGTATTNATVSYIYNGLGQVVRKTEATGDQIHYTYDDGGRLIQERRTNSLGVSGYTGHTGVAVTPVIEYRYDGLGNLSRTVAAGAAGVADRVSTYEYNAGGLLSKMTDAQGIQRLYFYDQSGRQVIERYSRTESNGTTTHTEGTLTSYDALGRVTEQKVARLSGSTWLVDTNAVGTDELITRTQYNAFGDVVRSGVNGIWQTENRYDLAGRMWSTNAGDGIWKFFGYDKNGNQTIAITSAGAQFTSATTFQAAYNEIGNTNVNATFTVYDARNMAVQVREEQREIKAGTTLNLDTYRTYNAFGEVATETDARGATLTYTYNTMGRMIRSESPTVEITYESGVTQWVKPSEDLYYDAAGRLVAKRDANGTYAAGGTSANGAVKNANTGNLTRLELLAGTGYGGSEAVIAKQINADGGITRTSFDVHGDARKVEVLVTGTEASGTWRTTTQEFDKLGRVTKVIQPNGLELNYGYDQLGQRTSEWNSVQGSANKQTTDYDKQGRVILTRAYGGDTISTRYDWNAALAAPLSSGGNLGIVGGWVETKVFINGRTSTESADIFGRTISKTDLGSNVTTFAYDHAGRQLTSTISRSLANGSGTSTATYVYLNTGQISSNANLNGVATYEYDAAGNRTRERLVYGALTVKDQTATYDLLGRMTAWSALGTSTAPAASEAHSYDANGNVRRTTASFSTLSSTGTGLAATTRDFWYRYDSMNRLVVHNGIHSGGTIKLRTMERDAPETPAEASYQITYNRAGDRLNSTSSIHYQVMWVEDLWGGYEYFYDDIYETHIEHYVYNAAGQVSEIWNEIAAGTPTPPPSNEPPAISVSDAVASEGNTLTFHVTLNQASTSSISVAYSTLTGTALSADYTAVSGTLTFAAGETVKTITVQAATDAVAEASEVFYLDLANPTNATIADSRGVGTILDVAPPVVPNITVNDVTVNEGNAATFTITLSQATSQAVTVNYATANGTATAADYTGISGSVTFAAGQTTRTVTVQTALDTLAEGNELFYLNLSNAVNGTITDSQGAGTIVNVTAATNPVVSITGGDTVEGSSILFTVSLSQASASAVTVTYQTSDVTAWNGSDYGALLGNLTFAAGETTKYIYVGTYTDYEYEGEESLLVALSNPSGGATISGIAGSAYGFIYDGSGGGGGGGGGIEPIVPFALNSSALLTQSASTSGSAPAGVLRSRFTYDLLGRLTNQKDYNGNGTQIVFEKTSHYNAKGQLIEDRSSSLKSDGYTYLQKNRFDYGSGANYALGSLVQSLSDTSRNNNDGDSPDTATRYTFYWYDSAVQYQIQHDRSYSNTDNALVTGWDAGTTLSGFDNDDQTTLFYNTFGQTTSAYVDDGMPRNVTYTLDEAGQIIRRSEERPYNAHSSQAGSPHEVWYRFAGAEMGYTGNNSTDNRSASSAADERGLASPTRTGTFRQGRVSAGQHTDFSGAYDSLNSYYQGSVAGSYTVRGGESLQQIAASTYGDSSLWYKIAEANGLSGNASLTEGTQLRLPGGVVKTTHNASTFKPYDPGEAIGDLSPTTPKPQKGNKCGVFGMILLAVVAVAVTALTQGTFAGIAGSILGTSSSSFGAAVLGGAIAGAAGSVASQAVGLATGIQDKFSFKSVGLAAIGGAVGGGLKGFEVFGKATNGTLKGIANAAVRGAAGSVISQGIGVATGLQSSFSWAGVAAAGVAAGVGNAIGGDGLPDLQGEGLTLSNAIAHTAVGAVRLLASSATRSAIDGSSFGKSIEAGLPDVIGQVIGQALGGAFSGANRSKGGGDAKSASHDEAHEVAHAAEASTSVASSGAGQQVGAISSQMIGDPSADATATTGDSAEQSIESRGREIIRRDPRILENAGNIKAAMERGDFQVITPTDDGGGFDIVGFDQLFTTKNVEVSQELEIEIRSWLSENPNASTGDLNREFGQKLAQDLGADGSRLFADSDAASSIRSGGGIVHVVYEPTSLLNRLVGGLADSEIGAAVFFNFAIGETDATAALRAKYPTGAFVGEYGGLILGLPGLVKGGIRVGAREAIEDTASALNRADDALPAATRRQEAPPPPPPPRTIDELVPGGRVPSIRNGEFGKWFDDLSPDEFDLVWADEGFRAQVSARIRAPGGFHEWLPVSLTPTFKRWGVPMSEIQRIRTPTARLNFIHPVTGVAGSHNTTKSAAADLHGELFQAVRSSSSLTDYHGRLVEIASRWSIDPSLLPGL